jgi:hypothetical protein
VFAIPATELGLPGSLEAMKPGAKTRAYHCLGTRCEAPLEEIGELEKVYDESRA